MKPLTLPLQLDSRAVEYIKDHARKRWHESRVPPESPVLILMGLSDYLKSKGIEPQFEVKNEHTKI